jgi:hypothetical protein
MPQQAVTAMQAAGQSMMRCNMEMVSLMSRRSRAYLDLPKQMSGCRTAAEVGQLGTQFWRDAFHDYVDFNQRVAAFWMQGMQAAGQGTFAQTATEFANRITEPMTRAAEQMAAGMEEHPTEPWSWWRTDVKGLNPQPNGRTRTESGARLGY